MYLCIWWNIGSIRLSVIYFIGYWWVWAMETFNRVLILLLNRFAFIITHFFNKIVYIFLKLVYLRKCIIYLLSNCLWKESFSLNLIVGDSFFNLFKLIDDFEAATWMIWTLPHYILTHFEDWTYLGQLRKTLQLRFQRYDSLIH